MGDTVEEGTDVTENHTTEMNNSTIYMCVCVHTIYIYDIFAYIKSMDQVHVQTELVIMLR